MLIQYYLDGIMFPCKTHFLMQISLHPPPINMDVLISATHLLPIREWDYGPAVLLNVMFFACFFVLGSLLFLIMNNKSDS